MKHVIILPIQVVKFFVILILFYLGCTTFEEYPFRYLSSNDQTSISGQTKETCQQLCSQDKDCPLV